MIDIMEVTLIFKGLHVDSIQGIGFRASTLKFANQRNIKGRVYNLSDGNVEVKIQACVDIIDIQVENLVQDLKNRYNHSIQKVSASKKMLKKQDVVYIDFKIEEN